MTCQSCNQRELAAGIMIPDCPPQDTIEFHSSFPEAEYYLLARSSHESYKATYDMLLPNPNTP